MFLLFYHTMQPFSTLGKNNPLFTSSDKEGIYILIWVLLSKYQEYIISIFYVIHKSGSAF